MKKLMLALVAVAGLTVTGGENFANAQSLAHSAPPAQNQHQNNWFQAGG